MLGSWPTPPLFDWLQEEGNISDEEMLKTFNCGIGMVVCVQQEDAPAVLAQLKLTGEDAFIIGDIAPAKGEPYVNYQ